MANTIFKRIVSLGLCVLLSLAAAVPLMGAAATVQAAGSGVSGNDVPLEETVCTCDEKCGKTTVSMDCVVCAADVSGCMGKEPEPVCFCDVKCTPTTPNMDYVVCAADVNGCTGKEPEPAPVCFCDVKCTPTTPNMDCVVCSADVSGCTGKELEPEPVCFCDVKCTPTTPNMDCVVCTTDVSGCTGKEPEPAPICNCASKCETGKVNADCPVCKTDLTACTGKAPDPVPVSDVTISILPPSGWHTRAADVSIHVTDEAGNGFSAVKVKVEKNGNWQDITDELEEKDNLHTGVVEISENCTIYVTVTGHDEQIFEKSRYIECFDRTAPTLRAAVDGRLLRAEADDDLSGVAAIYVDGERHTDLTNGTLDIRLRDLEEHFEQITVQAVDEAGNKSRNVLVKNPEYREPEEDQNQGGSQCPTPSDKPATPTTPTTPPATTPSKPSTPPVSNQPSGSQGTSSSGSSGSASTSSPSASASADPETKPDTKPRDPVPLTPDGQAAVLDNATGEDGKEFFTFTTSNDNTFYLVIDRQRDGENVYFLNAVTEDDLMALAEQGTEKPDVSAVPEPEPVCSCKEQCVPGEVNTSCPVCAMRYKDCTGKAPVPEEPEEEPSQGGGAGTIIFILIAVLAAGGAGYYFKIYKPKRELDDAEDFDEITGAEEEMVNEDEDVSQESDATQVDADEPEEPDYPDYPDEYGEEPEERG